MTRTKPVFTYAPHNDECLVCESVKFTACFMNGTMVEIVCDDCDTLTPIHHDNEGSYVPKF